MIPTKNILDKEIIIESGPAPATQEKAVEEIEEQQQEQLQGHDQWHHDRFSLIKLRNGGGFNKSPRNHDVNAAF